MWEVYQFNSSILPSGDGERMINNAFGILFKRSHFSLRDAQTGSDVRSVTIDAHAGALSIPAVVHHER
ncbi:hypothetical protein MJO28_010070 [Puccinia striiformis f. sp. tritici]|uniref:Uncharacterized protein n=1 Tax=Puccinia striiformis f. sp. tritici TaxID=168172 RepID=A0ACC0E9F6_9BASI|nr:hypothetical protein MJO28_010070 [Puccinia striiformis f. sp. tritici]